MSSYPRKRVFLLRHGETELTPARRFVGRSDLPLSLMGRKQAEAMREAVAQLQLQHCFCSPMLRTVETCQLVLNGTGPEPQVLAQLKEIDFGDWETFTFTQMQDKDPESAARWLRMDRSFRFGTGERLGTFFSRVKRAVAEINASEAERILVVTHGGIIRTMLCQVLRLPLKHFYSFEIGPASLTSIDLFQGGYGMLTALHPCPVKTEVPL